MLDFFGELQEEGLMFPSLTPTEFINTINGALEDEYEEVAITGEVVSFKINQGKWVFFDIKDEESSVPCFLTAWNLRVPLEDGMKISIIGTPKLTKWGKFSVTVGMIQLVGEGSLKKAYEKLKKKLRVEGLFEPGRKRGIPEDLTKIGVISSTQAAGYADFIKIINARWGGMRVQVAHTQVQGVDASDQIIRALKYFNEKSEVQMIAIIRGGGSADDLACFNDERLARMVAASKIPVITGIGHEVDESLVDLVADVRASTPSNAAEMLTRNKRVEREKVRRTVERAGRALRQGVMSAQIANHEKMERISREVIWKYIEPMQEENKGKMQQVLQKIQSNWAETHSHLVGQVKLVEVLNPEKVLKQGYAIMRGEVVVGKTIEVITHEQKVVAEVKKIARRN